MSTSSDGFSSQPNRRKSATCTVTGSLTEELRDAAAAALSPQAATDLARAYRAGDDDALTQLVAGLRWLCYAPSLPEAVADLSAARPDLSESLRLVVDPPGAKDYLDRAGQSWLAIFTVATRGRKPKSKVSDDIYRHVIAELDRSRRDLRIEDSRHIFAPDSTNSKRRKRGDDPYPDLIGMGGSIEDIDRKLSRDFPADDVCGYAKPIRSRSGHNYEDQNEAKYVASKLEYREPQYIEFSDDANERKIEQNICELLEHDYTLREIAEELGITLHQVRKAKAAIRERNE